MKNTLFSKFKIRINQWLIIGLLGVLLFSCKETNRNGSNGTESVTKTDPANPELLATQQQYNNLKANADTAWARMMADDDKRWWANAKIVTEITSLEKYDEAGCKKVLDQIEAIKKSRYTVETLGQPGIVDKYDAETDSIWAATKRLISKHPRINKYILVGELQAEIIAELNAMVKFRIAYRDAVEELNNFVSKHKSDLIKSGIPPENLGDRPNF